MCMVPDDNCCWSIVLKDTVSRAWATASGMMLQTLVVLGKKLYLYMSRCGWGRENRAL